MVQPLKIMFPIIFNVVGRCSRYAKSVAPGAVLVSPLEMRIWKKG